MSCLQVAHQERELAQSRSADSESDRQKLESAMAHIEQLRARLQAHEAAAAARKEADNPFETPPTRASVPSPGLAFSEKKDAVDEKGEDVIVLPSGQKAPWHSFFP